MQTNIFNKELVDMYYRPPIENETNLVDHICFFLSEYATEELSNIFRNDVEILQIAALNSVTQRIVINSTLLDKLLIYRYVSKNNINTVLSILANDGSTEDWLDMIREVLVPYLADNCVLETVENYKQFILQQG